MACKTEYKSSVWRDLIHLDKNIAKRMLKDTEGRLASDPAAGIPLTGQFKGLFKLRIGEYLDKDYPELMQRIRERMKK